MRDAAPTSATDVRIDWQLAAACAAGLTILFAIQNWMNDPSDHALAYHLVFQGVVWGTWLLLTPIVFRIGRETRRRGPLTMRGLAYGVPGAFGVALLHGLVSGVVRWVLHATATRELDVVLAGSTVGPFAASFMRFWMISAVYHAIAYHREVRERDARLAEARLESLEGRLHPHFLFNTLNTITALIREDPRAAEAMLADLSELLRASLSAEPGIEVTLERELDLLERYVTIQQTRFQDRLHVSIEADADVRGAFVPHLILQPLVENAIRHGIAPRESPGHLWVRAKRAGDVLRLLVQDDGVGFGGARRSEAGSGIGLTSTRARLAHLYGTRFAFLIGDAAPRGTIVTIELPFHTDAPRRPEPAAEAVA